MSTQTPVAGNAPLTTVQKALITLYAVMSVSHVVHFVHEGYPAYDALMAVGFALLGFAFWRWSRGRSARVLFAAGLLSAVVGFAMRQFA
ncbi:hypothetical protein [Lysobacter sp. HA18]